MEETVRESVSYTTVRRLPLYVPMLKAALEAGEQSISSAKIAAAFGLDNVLVRKDLASIGITGQARLGFPIRELINGIEQFLGWNKASEAFVIGAGNLGKALAGYTGFEQHGLKIIALFDINPDKVGQVIADKPVMSVAQFASLVRRMHVPIAILTVPAEEAQAAADMAASAGIKAIWNFTPARLVLPDEIIVEQVDLAASLAVLSSRLASSDRSTLSPKQPPEQAAR
ncbi:MAG TPA: redox-sensing transcriptional repressor Rex [Sedimentisphaerales bacterium]|nr:redox-sensing transcriptional repressor Rex [Sedimentisphaerales bacterium]